MKQTAVEWLQEKYKQQGVIFNSQFEQAKEMEKQQSKQDYDAGLFDGTMDDVKDRLYKNAEQYYNQEYGGEK